MSPQQPPARTEADVAYTSGYQTGKAHEAGRAQLDRAATEATKIEQSRAVAEVQAAIFVAQQFPRSVAAAIEAMRETCGRKGLAERAFFRYPRGEGKPVTGETIHLARELARVWGNIQYGIAELDRDDGKGQSEMLSEAWDVQTNTRVRNTFIVPHARDTTKGRKTLVDLRDVYENNANMGARRLRECIFAVVPKWFIEEAIDLCHKTLAAENDGKPRDVVIADALKAFAARGVTRDQLEQHRGRAADKWTDPDLATLAVVLKSLDRGEITIDDEFPDVRVTVAEITAPRESATASNTRPRQRLATNGRRSDALDDPTLDDPNAPTAEDIAAINAEAAADPQNAGS